MFMKYGDYWNEALKGFFIMFNKSVFKVYRVNSVTLSKLKRLEKKGYSEIPSEPTAGDIYLYSLKKNISFSECLELIKTNKCINILVAMSVIYYYFCEDLYLFIIKCRDEDKVCIKKNCTKTLKRWKSLMEKSDDLLYPQNKFIRAIVLELKI